jgi:3-oxoadipate enol-lactonase
MEAVARKAIARFAASVLSVRPLVEGLAVPVRVVPVARDGGVPSADWSFGQWGELGALLDRVARHARVAGLTLSRDVAFGDLQVFERVISNRLALAELANTVASVRDDLLGEADQVTAETVAESFDVFFRKETIVSSDGVPLNVYCAGPGGEAVVLVSACGMPAALAESWLRFLARDRRVLAWESRGLFGPVGHHGDYAVDTAAQAADLFTVMDHYGVSSVHVVGLCSGAVIALAAAADQPGRISSLSLWHGAYEFASGCPKTAFQQDLMELMAIAARSRAAARSLQTAFCQVALTSTPAEVAHFVLYPYANPELFYRYCRLNGSLASADVERYFTKVKQPTLVVTSQDDQTAHPQGSRQLAEGLPNARLRVEPHGDHSSLFRADSTLMQAAVDFIAHLLPPLTARSARSRRAAPRSRRRQIARPGRGR